MAKQQVVEKFPIRASTTMGQLEGYLSLSMKRVRRNMTPVMMEHTM